MSSNDIARAWKDPDRGNDVDHPAGEISLEEAQEYVGGNTEWVLTMGCSWDPGGRCGGFTSDAVTCITVRGCPICSFTIILP